MYRTYRRNRRHKKSNKTNKKRKGGSRKINCSPVVTDKTVNSSTCYTPDILIKIKDAYNKTHSREEYIPWSNPQEIWKTLNKRLVNCEKEDCWLSTIKDKDLEKELKDVIFAPEHPPEWLKNPNEWLTDLDISNVMKQYEETYPEFKFIGPSPIDFDSRVERGELPWANPGENSDKICVWEELCDLSLEKLLDQGKTQLGMVFNLDRYDEPGSHWVSLYLSLGEHKPSISKNMGGKNTANPNTNTNISIQWPTSDQNNSSGGKTQHKAEKEGAFVFYFDSTGRSAPAEIKKLIDRIQEQGKSLQRPIDIKSYNNNGQDHQKSNTECGMYSLFFLITMLTGKIEDSTGTNKLLLLDFNTKMTLFRDAIIPDKYVEIYRHKYFNQPA
jgi:hypothetical protein